MKQILLTCPPMIRSLERCQAALKQAGFEVAVPEFTQTLPEEELIKIVPQYDGWIIGDDPATRRVFEAGVKGKLRAAVKWGVGVDNVDLVAARELGLPISNVPGMFGREVADLALSYVIALARQWHVIDRGVKQGNWLKPAGMSLSGKRALVIGFGDIGRQTAKRLLACEMEVSVVDPYFAAHVGLEAVKPTSWPEGVVDADFLVFTCALTPQNFHMLNAEVLAQCKSGVRIVNVARGPLIEEEALIASLESGQVHSAALEVFECEPLSKESPLHQFENCIFGSHNASNTVEAVVRTSERAVELMKGFFEAGMNTKGEAK